MKPIEEAFASDSFRRVILPGIVLAIGIHPLISTWEVVIESIYGIGPTVLLVAEVVLCGLLISSATQWIYYVYEGFRLSSLTALARQANERKLRFLTARFAALDAKATRSNDEENEFSTAYEGLLDFPVRALPNGAVERYCERPTRLGNIIAVYELYAQTRYGFDGVFYWYHLLSFGPEQSRKDWAEQMSFGESLVLTSFAGVLVCVLHLLVLAGFGIGALSKHLVFLSLRTGPIASFLLFLVGVAIWWLFYLAALPAHRDAGKILQSAIDIAIPSFSEWVNKVRAPLEKPVADRVQQLNRYIAEPETGNKLGPP